MYFLNLLESFLMQSTQKKNIFWKLEWYLNIDTYAIEICYYLMHVSLILRFFHVYIGDLSKTQLIGIFFPTYCLYSKPLCF